MGLDLQLLRQANALRLPEFKNKHGVLAHSKPDGSDWSPAQWFQAVVGELGEWAQVRVDFEHGNTDRSEYERESPKELADVLTYTDILARRALDTVHETNTSSPAQLLMGLMAALGAYANLRKKFERGDIAWLEYTKKAQAELGQAKHMFGLLHSSALVITRHGVDVVEAAHAEGVDLGKAAVDKFNEVSKRVGAKTFISPLANGEHTICDESFYEVNKR